MYLMKHFNNIPLLFCFLSFSLFAQENIELTHNNSQHTDSSLLPDLHKIGEGKMKILFWKVYKAEFYANEKNEPEYSSNKALKLTYQRNIEKKEFIEATEDQWNKLNKLTSNKTIPKAQETKWLDELNNIFPDITENDIILFILNEQKQSHFYLKSFNKKSSKHNQHYKLIGRVTDPLFGEHFLSIWLSKYTSEPQLRKNLLGQ